MSQPSKKSKIEILVVNHKPSYVPENSLLKPIQVGVDVSGAKLPGMAYYDNTGNNISSKNRSYCELTAIYWAWKNLDAEYYGLFHYRRYLSFADDHPGNPFAGKAYDTIQDSLSEIRLEEPTMRRLIEANDLVIPRKDDSSLTTKNKTIYEQYAQEHYIEDLDICVSYIEKKYPNVAEYSSALHTSQAYYCNMFIMKKEIFRGYCEFMFDVLSYFDKMRDISGYNVQQYRVNGFLAERLTNIYIHYLKGQNKYRVKELQMTYYRNTDPLLRLEPIAKKDNVAIVLAANNFYVPYISTLLHSVAEYSSDNNTYDITIFHQDITAENKALLQSEFKTKGNINIRFYDMSARASEYSKLFTKWHFTVETYFRLFIQDIMTGYDKVLYLDGDMIVKADVAELYNVEVSGYLLAACRDIDMAGVYTSNSVKADDTIDPKRKTYIDTVLKINSPLNYFQAGVILFNLEEMRNSFDTKKALQFAASRQWEYLDQDVLNYFAQGRVKFLDLSWNVLYDWEFVRIKNVISKAPIGMYLEYMESRKNPKILHYGGTVKPWQRPDCDFGNEFWKVARNSEYYELILGRMADWRLVHMQREHTCGRPSYFHNKVVRRARRIADRVAPVGSGRRVPITYTSHVLKRIIRGNGAGRH